MISVHVVLSIASAIALCGPAPPHEGAQEGVWGTGLTPDQVDLRPASAAMLLEIIESSDADVVLVNMWATWCMPCRDEFPHIVRLYRDYAARGLEVIFVSGDLESDQPQVLEFLAAQGVDFTSYLKVGKDMEFIDTFYPGWSGLLPATFIYDSEKSLQHFWEGEASYEIFESRVLATLSQLPESNSK